MILASYKQSISVRRLPTLVSSLRTFVAPPFDSETVCEYLEDLQRIQFDSTKTLLRGYYKANSALFN